MYAIFANPALLIQAIIEVAKMFGMVIAAISAIASIISGLL